MEDLSEVESLFWLWAGEYTGGGGVVLKHSDSFGQEKKRKKTCSIFDKTLSKVFLNNFHALNQS